MYQYECHSYVGAVWVEIRVLVVLLGLQGLRRTWNERPRGTKYECCQAFQLLSMDSIPQLEGCGNEVHLGFRLSAEPTTLAWQTARCALWEPQEFKRPSVGAMITEQRSFTS